MTSFPLFGNPMPVRGPVDRTSRFSGENGSVPCLRLSHRIFAANPRPPMNFNAICSS